MRQPLVSQDSTVGEALKRVGLMVVEGLLVNVRSGHQQRHRRLVVQNAREELHLLNRSLSHGGEIKA